MTTLDIPEVLIIILVFGLIGLAIHQLRYTRHHH